MAMIMKLESWYFMFNFREILEDASIVCIIGLDTKNNNVNKIILRSYFQTKAEII